MYLQKYTVIQHLISPTRNLDVMVIWVQLVLQISTSFRSTVIVI